MPAARRGGGQSSVAEKKGGEEVQEEARRRKEEAQRQARKQEPLERQLAALVAARTGAGATTTIPLMVKAHVRGLGREVARAMPQLPALTPPPPSPPQAPPRQPSAAEQWESLRARDTALDATIVRLNEEEREWRRLQQSFAAGHAPPPAEPQTEEEVQAARARVQAALQPRVPLPSIGGALGEMTALLQDLNDALSGVRNMGTVGAAKLRALVDQLNQDAFAEMDDWDNPKKLFEQIATTKARKL